MAISAITTAVQQNSTYGATTSAVAVADTTSGNQLQVQTEAANPDTTSPAAFAAYIQRETTLDQQGLNTTENSQMILGIGMTNMVSDMTSFSSDFAASKAQIAAQRPDLLNANWDIVTDQGTIQVVSNTLSAGDKAWLTGILNQNQALVADTQAINTTLVSTFGGTAQMAADDPLGMTLTSLNLSSIDGKVNFLSLLQGSPMTANESVSQATDISFNNTAEQTYGYERRLYDAFNQYLSPAFSSTSATDGTDPFGGQTGLDGTTDEIAQMVSEVHAEMGSISGNSAEDISLQNGIVQSSLGATAYENLTNTLESALGSNYRYYGEALTAGNGGAATSTSGAGLTPSLNSVTSSVTSAGSDVQSASQSTASLGSAGSATQGNATGEASLQVAVASALTSLEADWTASQSAINAKRPALFAQKWDFVTDDGTLQVTSSGLSQEQSLWLTAKLNQNTKLVADAESVNQDAAQYLDKAQPGAAASGGAASHPAAIDLDGDIQFRALMSGASLSAMLESSASSNLAVPLGVKS